MISGATKTNLDMASVIRIQSIILKAIHDFMEENDILQILPLTLSRAKSSSSKSDNSIPIIKVNRQKLQFTQSMTLHKQIAIGRGFDSLYVISPNIRMEQIGRNITQDKTIEHNQLEFEVRNYEMEQIFQLAESMLRRVLVDVKQKGNEIIENHNIKLPEWKDKFPVYSSHDLELQWGEEWYNNIPEELNLPFWVTCLDPNFYDKSDPDRGDNHYLNFEMYFPGNFGKAITGSEREYRYDKLMEQMKELGISRYNYSQYLIAAQQGELIPSAGFSLEIERLIQFVLQTDHISNIQLFKRMPGHEIKF